MRRTRRIYLLLFVLSLSLPAFGQQYGRVSGFCEDGGQLVTVNAAVSVTRVQRSYPLCTVTVFDAGTVSASTIYADATGTSKGNPFTAAADGQWFFYGWQGVHYDVRFSGGGITAPFTRGDLVVPVNTLPMVDCASFTAAVTAGAKIIACLAAVPSTGGVADARKITGAQVISSNVTVDANKVLLLGAAVYTLSSTITLSTGSSLQGLAPSDRTSGRTALVRSGTNTMISASGSAGNHVHGFSINNIYIDGNGAAGHGMVFQNVDTFYIDNVQMRNGSGAFSALRLVDEVWDFWVTNSLFMAWGNTVTPAVNLVSNTGPITDGHWISDVIGDLDATLPLGMPSIVSDTNTLQQRFVDVKFHTTGVGQTQMMTWGGYRSDWIGCTWQSDQAASTGMVKFTSADNRIIGGEFSDVNNSHAIVMDSSGEVQVIGTTFRGSGAPSPGSAVAVGSGSWNGKLVVSDVRIISLTNGINISTGTGTITLGPNQCTSVTNCVVRTTGTWSDYDAGAMTATFGGSNAPTARSAATLNPTLRLGGNTATNSAGYQGIYVMPLFAGGGQINELIGMGSSWLAGIGSVFGTNIEHPITWCFASDANCLEIYTKSAGTPVAGAGKIFGINSNGSLLLTNISGAGFAGLGTPASGTVTYCADCTNASNPCTGGGTGAIAKRLNGAWDCR